MLTMMLEKSPVRLHWRFFRVKCRNKIYGPYIQKLTADWQRLQKPESQRRFLFNPFTMWYSKLVVRSSILMYMVTFFEHELPQKNFVHNTSFTTLKKSNNTWNATQATVHTTVVFVAGVCTIVVSVADFTPRDAVTTSLALELIVAAR